VPVLNAEALPIFIAGVVPPNNYIPLVVIFVEIIVQPEEPPMYPESARISPPSITLDAEILPPLESVKLPAFIYNYSPSHKKLL
jgi:hypothetical protein